MKIKIATAIVLLALSALPLYANATIMVANNTNSSATAKTGDSPCSSHTPSFYGKGVIDPGQSMTIPYPALLYYCSFGCVAHVYMNDNCQPGDEIGTATIDGWGNVTSVSRQIVNGYKLTQNGNTVSVSRQGLLEKLLSIFG